MECNHFKGSLPVAIEGGEVVWQCIDCPERWTDNITPSEALDMGWITREELDALSAMQ